MERTDRADDQASLWRAALEEFTELRWITVQELPGDYPI
jgi:hypothetical protein